MKKNIITFFICLLLIVMSVFFSRSLIGATYLKLPSGELDKTISSSLQISSGQANLPLNGVDYTIKSINYFENRTWLVVSIVSVGTNNSALFVLIHQGGIYKNILGPGTTFSPEDLKKLPVSVSNYLNK